MDNIKKMISILLTLLVVASCSQVLENVELGKFTDQQLIAAKNQDNFDIELKTLTMKKAKEVKSAPYIRFVSVQGAGAKANIYSESEILNGELPPETKSQEYVLGVGDQLQFLQLTDNNSNKKIELLLDGSLGARTKTENYTDNIINTFGRIGSDGSILLLGIGRLKAVGKTITQLRSEVRNILIRNGLAPNFQLEIKDFDSKKAFLFSSNEKNGIIPITDRPLSLKELAARASYQEKKGHINKVLLTRNKKVYSLNNSDLFDENRQEIIIHDKDQIKFETFKYKMGKVYTLIGTDKASIVKINPSERETMADIMFTEGGPLSNKFAKRSEVYLLRGTKPIIAYHLDAQNASRILVAAEMELRPSDIVYVADRPIISFARLLSELSPLRALLSDLLNNEL